MWPTLITFGIALSITFLGMYVYMSAVQAYLGDTVYPMPSAAGQ